MPYLTYSLFVSEAGVLYLFCIRHMEFQFESLSTGLAWERGEWWLLAGCVWVILAHFLCCLDLCKPVFEPRGQTPYKQLSEVTVAMRWQVHSTAPLHSRECPVCTKAIGHLGQAVLPAVRMPELLMASCLPSPVSFLPSLFFSVAIWAMLIISEGQQSLSPPAPRRTKAPTWIHPCIYGWSLPCNPAPRELAQMQPGIVCICEDLEKRLKMLSGCSIFCQLYLQ